VKEFYDECDYVIILKPRYIRLQLQTRLRKRRLSVHALHKAAKKLITTGKAIIVSAAVPRDS